MSVPSHLWAPPQDVTRHDNERQQEHDAVDFFFSGHLLLLG